MKNKEIFIYIAIIYFFSWLMQLFAIYGTDGINSKQAELFLLITMLVPMLVTVVYLIKNKALRSKILWKPNLNIFKTILLGVLIPTLIAFITVALFTKLDYGNSMWFDFLKSGVNITGGPWLLGIGENSWLLFAANILITGFVYSFISGIPAAFEEFTWRGFLQGILIDKTNTTKGIIILGLIWSFWHLPALLAGYNHPEYPILGSFILQPLQEIAISFFLAWLTITSKSFIPAAIAHGAGNSIQEGVLSNIQLSVPMIYKDLFTIFVTIIAGLIFWFLLYNKKHKTVG